MQSALEAEVTCSWAVSARPAGSGPVLAAQWLVPEDGQDHRRPGHSRVLEAAGHRRAVCLAAARDRPLGTNALDPL